MQFSTKKISLCEAFVLFLVRGGLITRWYLLLFVFLSKKFNLHISFCYFVHLLQITRPTLQSVGDESIGLFTFSHSPAGAAVGLNVGADERHRPSSASSFRVQGGIGRSQEAGRVWICSSRVVNSAVPSEAVCVRLA